MMITIMRAEYDALVKRVDWLDCLEAAGVDNWEGIEEAIRLRKGGSDEESYEDIYGEE